MQINKDQIIGTCIAYVRGLIKLHKKELSNKIKCFKSLCVQNIIDIKINI